MKKETKNSEHKHAILLLLSSNMEDFNPTFFVYAAISTTKPCQSINCQQFLKHICNLIKTRTSEWNWCRRMERECKNVAKITCKFDGSFYFTTLNYEQRIKATQKQKHRKKNQSIIFAQKIKHFACQRISFDSVQFYKKHYKSVLFHRFDSMVFCCLLHTMDGMPYIPWNFTSL